MRAAAAKHGRSRARNRGACKVTRPVGYGARDCASLQFRLHLRAGYPPPPPSTDTCCRSIHRSMTPYAKFRTRQKVGQSARCWLKSPKGDRKRHGASEKEREAGGLQTIDVLPMHLPCFSLFPILYVFAKASAQWGEDDYERVFLTQKARKPTPKYEGSVRRAL